MTITKSLKVEGGYQRGSWFIYYDRASRAWWAYDQDAEGNQTGDAICEFRRSDIERRIDNETN